MRNLKPGDTVNTPHGSGKLLHPVPRTQRREWVVMIGRHGEFISVDEMGDSSTQFEGMSMAATYGEAECVPKPRNLEQTPEDISTGGTRQMEMGL